MQGETRIVMVAQHRPDRTFKTSLLPWWKGNDSVKTLREMASLLDSPPIQSRLFSSLPTPTPAVTLTSARIRVRGEFPRSRTTSAPEISNLERVCWLQIREQLIPHFLFVPWDCYDIDAQYEKAKSEFDPYYSPHGSFRKLGSNNTLEVLDFVKEFGPLELLNEEQSRQELESLIAQGPEEISLRSVWVNLGDFRLKHRRFSTVAKLLEARETPAEIVSALAEVAKLKVNPPIGAVRDGGRYLGWEYLSPTPPWYEDFEQWAGEASQEQIMDAAVDIIRRELNLNADGLKVVWQCQDPSRLEFRIQPRASSLWSAIWYLFGRDTTEGIGWRVCPHCSKLFYPKRKDSYFCESKYQKLHAANRWWNQHSGEELDKRRKERATAQPPRKRAARKPKTKGSK